MKKLWWILGVVVVLAVIALRPDGCSAPGLSTDQCWFEEAIATENKELCQHINDQLLLQTCIADVATRANDKEGCMLLEGKTKSYCVATIAMNLGEGCDTVEDGYWRDICYQTLAIESSTTSECRLVGTQELRDTCYTTVSAVLSDEEICAFVTDTVKRSLCFTDRAIEKEDVMVCELIEATVNEQVCMMKVAIALQDVSICEEITAGPIHARCLERLNGS